MTGRRQFLTGLLAAGSCPQLTWAQAGAPTYLAAGRSGDGQYQLCGLGAQGDLRFSLPLPARGHAAAAHPDRPLAVGFARRPGRFALVIDCVTGQETARLMAPEGRHFYGHGVFSHDGARLFTTENDYDAARGVVGVWNVDTGARLGEFDTGGVGPHDIRLMPDGATLVVANGGIETHPDSGRAKLNLPLMAPNLSFLSLDGTLLEKQSLDRRLHRNSIRHLAVAPDGTVGFAMQWQGDLSRQVPLLGLTRRGAAPRLLQAPGTRRMRGYAGSIAIHATRNEVAITSPRGNLCQVFNMETGELARQIDMADVCGLAATKSGFLLTSGTGRVMAEGAGWTAEHPLQWDNHLIPV